MTAPRIYNFRSETAARATPPPIRSTPPELAVATRASRVVIENITPSAEEFSAKRIVGDTVTVEADIFTDGHPQLAAQLLVRPADRDEWVAATFRPLANDRWVAEFNLPRVGDHVCVIEAWIDRYGSYAHDLRLKREAGQDVPSELADGFQLILEAMRDAARRGPLTAIIDALCELSPASQVELLLAPETMEVMRQAGPRKQLARSVPFTVTADRKKAAFASWYELFPRSQGPVDGRHGTLRDVIDRLPSIRDMGFDVLYLPPVHPIGETNRKGRNNALRAEPGDPGSVYAIGSANGGHDAIHPELGTLEDFLALVDQARAYGMEIALDFAVQCSPDHPWVREHPGWFDWRADGSIKFAENPPKKYEDIVNVDFYARDAVPDLWLALRDVVRFWISNGVRIFRVDNPHTKPFPFWQWLIADIRSRDPDVIFLAEAFTRPKIMYCLAKLGFSQSYTYFAWRNSKEELTAYLTELTTPPISDFFRPHFFVNTPDINPFYLQKSGRGGFLIRAALAATLSGLWGIFSGFELCEAEALPEREEYANSDKYEVRKRDWSAPANIREEIAALNRIRQAEPALQSHLGLTFYNAFNPNVLYFGKRAPGQNARILVIVSLNPHDAEDAAFEAPLWEWDLPDHETLAAHDLLAGDRIVWHGKVQHAHLTPDAPYRIWRVGPVRQD